MSNSTPTKAETDLWLAYATRLKDNYLKDVQFGGDNRLYIPLLNSVVVMGGDNVSPSKTAYGFLTVGDSLLRAESPMFTSSGGSYAQNMLRYMGSAQAGGRSDPGLEQMLGSRLGQAAQSRKDYDRTLVAAKKAWIEDMAMMGGGLSFSDWVQSNYPQLTMAQHRLDSDNSMNAQMMRQMCGPNYGPLESDLRKVVDANNATRGTPFNMTVDSARPSNGYGAGDDRNTAIQYAPKYSADQSYSGVVQGWIQKAMDQPSERIRVITFSNGDAGKDQWSRCGFENPNFSATGGMGSGCLFSADYRRHEEVHIESSNTQFSCEIEAAGARAFDIAPDGSWNVDNVKQRYPKLFPGVSDDVVQPVVQVCKMVIAYNVTVRIVLDKSIYEKIKGIMREAGDSGEDAKATLFGFRLALGRGAQYEQGGYTSFDKIKFDDGGSCFEFPGSDYPVPILLGIVGKVMA